MTKKTQSNNGFYRPAEPQMKFKVNEKRDKYLDFAWELNKLWNMKLMLIPIAIGALATVRNGLERALEELEIVGRIETIQTTALLI